MSSTKDEQKLALVSRMLSYQQDNGESTPVTLKQLSSKLPEEYRETIDDVNRIISGDARVLSGYDSARFLMLIKLMNVARSEGVDTTTMLANISQSVTEAINQADDFWGVFQTLMSYLVVVFAIAMMVVSIFMEKVLPEFRDVFDDFNAELPEFTRFVLDNELALFIIVIGIGQCVLVSALLSVHIKGRVSAFEPLSRWCRLIPGIRDLHSIYGYYLYIQYARILMQTGMKSVDALSHGKILAQVDTDNIHELSILDDGVAIASDMRVLDKELPHQIQQVSVKFIKQMTIIRDRITRSTQAATGVIIGGLIIAMYLPIFQLGSTT
ncbi:hypothetical protein A9Q99_18005 [Gammaproteobacteria bacterium 45_16_T64]|nr:hypothetical protein A9Q99_18005 [Gammaproteobacteria bacterium 45_16_T64]